jgi:hypothetical protein
LEDFFSRFAAGFDVFFFCAMIYKPFASRRTRSVEALSIHHYERHCQLI